MDSPQAGRRVFIAETSGDTFLETARTSVMSAGCEPVLLEVVAGESVVQAAYDTLSRADVLLLILSAGYGYIPTRENPSRLSVAHLAYRRALELAYPTLAYVHAQEKLEARERSRLESFRRELSKDRPTSVFASKQELAELVARDLWIRPRGESFDVFLSHHSNDAEPVRELASRLGNDGIRAWADVVSLNAGDEWRTKTQQAFDFATKVAIFVGRDGIGRLQAVELVNALERKRVLGPEYLLIPVLLPGAKDVPAALAKYQWVRFRESIDEPEAYRALRDAILSRPAAPERRPEPPGEDDLQMLPELLFRLVIGLRQRPEMLQSLDPTAFWAMVRKMQPDASTLADLRRLHEKLRPEPGPGALWASWMRNTRRAELAALADDPAAQLPRLP